MATLQDLREIALALPEVEESTHFQMPSFRVSGKNFISVQNGDVHVSFAMAESWAQQLLDEAPLVYQAVRRFDKLIGVWADLTKMTVEQLRHTIDLSWRSKAPKTLVAALDNK